MSTAPKKQEAKSDAKPEEKAGFKPKKSCLLYTLTLPTTPYV